MKKMVVKDNRDLTIEEMVSDVMSALESGNENKKKKKNKNKNEIE